METKQKYTFKQFIAALDSRNFDTLDHNSIETTKSFFQKLNDLDFVHIENNINDRRLRVCDLCKLQAYLEEYRLYYFDEEQYRKEYLSE
jgi:hypothetical protein